MTTEDKLTAKKLFLSDGVIRSNKSDVHTIDTMTHEDKLMITSKLLLGDCLEEMKKMEENSVDSIVTDPPYGIGFMGKAWDTFKPGYAKDIADKDRTYPESDGSNARQASDAMKAGKYDLSLKAVKQYQDWCYEWAKECLRVLKPGGHLLASNSSRMYHRMAVAIEDAGFEIRDQIMWVYGSGFPKSHNIHKASPDCPEGWGTALKPAHEPIVVARKPLGEKTVAENVLKWGTGGINIDGCRVEVDDKECPPDELIFVNGATDEQIESAKRIVYSAKCSKKDRNEGCEGFEGQGQKEVQGRFPANFIHDGSEEVVGMFPETKSGARKKNYSVKNKSNSIGIFHKMTSRCESSEGSASRFFYCAKASKKDREEGNNHPTVKPTALMQYLVRLVTPKDGTVLDPFMGSGSTGKACKLEGFNFIGIEMEEEYIKIAEARIESVPNTLL